jgi:coenzyme F420-reducing hydrogenase alpha subunit
MSQLTPDQVLVTPAGELAELSSESLFKLKNDAADLLAAAKAIVEHVDRALDLRYAQRAHQLRLAAGKDTGVVHFDDGQVRITADLPKKVEWDQAKLNDITRRIAANGEDPTEYVEISYRISETKFNAWPETLKSAFAPARTLKTGKPGFRLALIQE